MTTEVTTEATTDSSETSQIHCSQDTKSPEQDEIRTSASHSGDSEVATTTEPDQRQAQTGQGGAADATADCSTAPAAQLHVPSRVAAAFEQDCSGWGQGALGAV